MVKAPLEYCSDNKNIIQDWDYEKNYLNPTETRASLKANAYFICHKHSKEYTKGIVLIRDGKIGCNICLASKNIITGLDDALTLTPDKLKNWSPKNNYSMSEIGVKSRIEAIFIGGCGHEFITQTRYVFKKNGKINCPECIAKRLSNSSFRAKNNLINKNELSEEIKIFIKENNFNWEIKNGHLYILCKKNHLTKRSITVINDLMNTNSKIECQICKQFSNRIKLENELSLEPHIDKLKRYWSIFNEKSFKELCFPDTNRYLWQNGYSLRKATIREFASSNYTFRKNGFYVIEDFNSINAVYPNIAKRLVNFNDALNTHCESRKKLEWRCENHEKTFYASIINIIKTGGCPYCSGNSILPGYNDLKTKYPELIENEWSYKNIINPSLLFPSSKEMAIWTCEKHGDYERVIKDKAIGGIQCKKCSIAGRSKVEEDIAQLIEDLGYTVIRNSKIILGNRKELDIYLPQLRLAVEYNGDYWHTFPDSVEDDENKLLKTIEKNISLFTIWESEWKYNRELTEQNLISFIRHKELFQQFR